MSYIFDFFQPNLRENGKAYAYLGDWFECPDEEQRDTVLCGNQFPEIWEADVYEMKLA